MKKICLLLTLLLLLGSLSGCLTTARPGSEATLPASAPATKTPAETEAPAETKAPAGTEAPSVASEAEYLPDFTVQTVVGGTFTLSEALKDHELVLINLFATWCGPCAMEFPFLEEAWQERADQVAVIALTIEPTDTDEVLAKYAEEKGITFPLGHESGTDLVRFVEAGIPTTILVDRSGRVAAVEVGAKQSTQEFLDLFDDFTGPDYDTNLCTYTVCAYDARSQQMLPGVVVNFCTDVSCTPVTTDETGTAIFRGVPARYHVQVVSAPAGKKAMSNEEFTTKPYAETHWIPFEEAQP